MWKLSIVMGGIVFYYALSATGSFSAIPAIVVRVLSLGDISAARLVVSGDACNQINGAVGQQVCASDSSGASTICPVIIRSRIGSDVVLEFAELAAEKIDHKPVERKMLGKVRDLAPQGTGRVNADHRFFWITTDGAVDGKSGVKISRRVILEKSNISAWRPLTSIFERDRRAGPVAEHSAPYVGAAMAVLWGNGGKALGDGWERFFSENCDSLSRVGLNPVQDGTGRAG
jgi:hypothetical protein